jgi:hypothetical protein
LRHNDPLADFDLRQPRAQTGEISVSLIAPQCELQTRSSAVRKASTTLSETSMRPA